MLVRILTYYQVMPNFLDFLLLFGSHQHSREKGFSGFRAELMFDRQSLQVDDLGRSGRYFQLCYNLKTIAKQMNSIQSTDSDCQWSVRQGAIHHQFDACKGTALWIITRAGLDIKKRIESMTGKSGRDEERAFQTPEHCFRSSLAVHLLLCHWSSENWRSYLQWLEDSVANEVRKPNHMFRLTKTDAIGPDVWNCVWPTREE